MDEEVVEMTQSLGRSAHLDGFARGLSREGHNGRRLRVSGLHAMNDVDASGTKSGLRCSLHGYIAPGA